MKKLVSSDKNSFSILEILISIFILSIIVIGFSNYSYYENLDKEYVNLNKIENAFTTKIYSTSFSKTNATINIIKNNSNVEIKNIKKVTYDDGSIKLYKYEL